MLKDLLLPPSKCIELKTRKMKRYDMHLQCVACLAIGLFFALIFIIFHQSISWKIEEISIARCIWVTAAMFFYFAGFIELIALIERKSVAQKIVINEESVLLEFSSKIKSISIAEIETISFGQKNRSVYLRLNTTDGEKLKISFEGMPYPGAGSENIPKIELIHQNPQMHHHLKLALLIATVIYQRKNKTYSPDLTSVKDFINYPERCYDPPLY